MIGSQLLYHRRGTVNKRRSVFFAFFVRARAGLMPVMDGKRKENVVYWDRKRICSGRMQGCSEDRNMKFLVFGSMNVDHVYRVGHIVRPGETLSAAELRKNEGGKGLNQAVALARAGQPVYMAGAVGEDGGMLTDFLEASGVRTELIRRLDGPNGHAVIQVDANGQNAIFLFGGSNRRIGEEQLRETLAGFEKGDWLLLQNEINCTDRLIALAAEKGMRIILNPSPFTEDILSWPLEKLEWLILNEVEAAAMTGETEPGRALDRLKALYPAVEAVMTLGAGGAWATEGEQRVFQPAFPVDAVDTTGAGDTFTGYFFRGIASGMPVPKALCLAAKAASVAVTRSGAAASVPWAEELGAE